MSRTRIVIGIGGWTFPPWCGTFYPPGLPHARELEFASRQVTSIEINGTFYRTQTVASFAKWRDETPDGFVFSLKAARYATHRRELSEAGESIGWFLNSGIVELGAKLGPLVWQFPPTRQFDRDAFAAFLALLPTEHGGLRLRHAIEVYHASFHNAAFVDLLRENGVAHVIVESGRQDLFADMTADFAYARLERNELAVPEGYASGALDAWTGRVRAWASGEAVSDLPLAKAAEAEPKPRDCFMYFIGGDKVRAPDSARGLLRRLG